MKSNSAITLTIINSPATAWDTTLPEWVVVSKYIGTGVNFNEVFEFSTGFLGALPPIRFAPPVLCKVRESLRMLAFPVFQEFCALSNTNSHF
jgi:hypothetical protein